MPKKTDDEQRKKLLGEIPKGKTLRKSVTSKDPNKKEEEDSLEQQLAERIRRASSTRAVHEPSDEEKWDDEQTQTRSSWVKKVMPKSGLKKTIRTPYPESERPNITFSPKALNKNINDDDPMALIKQRRKSLRSASSSPEVEKPKAKLTGIRKEKFIEGQDILQRNLKFNKPEHQATEAEIVNRKENASPSVPIAPLVVPPILSPVQVVDPPRDIFEEMKSCFIGKGKNPDVVRFRELYNQYKENLTRPQLQELIKLSQGAGKIYSEMIKDQTRRFGK